MDPQTIQIGWFAAFFAGVVSFLSPCILPLIPGYMSLITKLSYDQLTDNEDNNKYLNILLPSIIFVLGFSFVFVSLGASASLFGTFFSDHKTILIKISGILIILFGLFTMEILTLPQLNREKRFNIGSTNLGMFGTFLLGCAFGFGWTPCVGPILASILLYASTNLDTSKGATLLLVYSLGLGLPFIITGLAYNKALCAFSIIKNNYRFYKYFVGIILIIVGLMILGDKIYYLNIYGQKFLDAIGIDFWKRF